MRICTDASRLALTAGQTASLRDVVLGPGQEVRLDRAGATLVHAFEPSQVLVLESRPAAPGPSAWKRLAHGLTCYFMELGMRRSAWRRAYRI